MPTLEEYAVLAAAVYNDNKSVNRLGSPDGVAGWKLFDSTSDTANSVLSTGFSANAYISGNSIVISYEGTDFLIGSNNGQTAADALADIGLGIGAGSQQLLLAAQFYEKVKAEAQKSNPGAKITLTGHSLGAGLASVIGDWMGVDATVFANAPFLPSALNPLLRMAIKQQLSKQGYDVSNMPSDGFFTGARQVISRESYVDDYYVQGEVLSKYFGPAGQMIQGSSTQITIGDTAVSSVNLHSMVLHAALLINDQLRKDILAAPDLLVELFDQTLYARKLESRTDQDFLSKLLNEQISTSLTGSSGIMSLFAKDIAKIGKLDTSSVSNNIDKALIATVIEAYYAMDPSSAKSFLTALKGGVTFNLSDIAGIALSAQLGRQRLLDALSGMLGPRGSAALGYASSTANWYVQGGATGMVANSAGTASSVMIGGGTGNDLTGGAGTNVLVGGNGGDTLRGGTGVNYFFSGFAGNLLYGNGSDIFQFNNSYSTGAGVTSIYETGSGTVWLGSKELIGSSGGATNFVWTDSDGTDYRYQGSLSGAWGALGTYMDAPVCQALSS
jgi:hypothetical protein